MAVNIEIVPPLPSIFRENQSVTQIDKHNKMIKKGGSDDINVGHYTKKCTILPRGVTLYILWIERTVKVEHPSSIVE